MFPIILILFIILLQTSCNNENKKMKEKKQTTKKLIHPEWSKNTNIYEVNIRQYTPEGTLKAFEKHLPRLKQMGVDMIWLMPIQPIGEKNRKGTLGSYYSIKDYMAVNPEFGTMKDFKELVGKAHELGLHVIIDWVANHSAWDNKMIEDHPDWYTKDSAGNFVSPFDWTDVVDLNYDNKEMRRHMIDALKFWVVETDIDGYRCDVAGMVPLDFWNEARKELDQIKPVFMLAEAEEPPHHKEAYDMSYAWDLHHILNDVAKGEKNSNDIAAYFVENDSLFMEDAYRMNFTSNHDENSWNGTEYERMGDGALAFAAFSATIPGMPLIYSGQEAAFNRRLEFFEKDQIDWDKFQLNDFYKKLLTLKKNNKALWNGSYGGKMIRIPTSNDEAIFAFTREKDGDKIFAIFNFTGEEQNVVLSVESFTGNYQDVFSGNKRNFSANEEIEIGPWGYFVFEKQ
ncbi:MAG: alpha-glucosidase C-terminal domain-containing protein [Bacteroidales bacterium]|nr:alpha-glucosidase C-terminal domain-containing protein [Bacteroidales bacterium]